MDDIILETERLTIRNWRDEDRALFHQINSDERVMAFFPFRRDRAASDAMMDDVRAGIENLGYGFAALVLKQTEEAIGFCGLADASSEDKLDGHMVEIGWRLAPQFWGHGYATEAARAWLNHGFNTLNLPEIVAFAVETNARSFAVMERLGMKRDPNRDFDHPSVPDTHPHLKRQRLYYLDNPKKKGP